MKPCLLQFILLIVLCSYRVDEAKANGCTGSTFTLTYSPVCGCYQFCAGQNNSFLISDCDNFVDFTLDWGDGSPSYIFPMVNGFADPNATPCHAYAPGTYTATLTINGYCHSIFAPTTCVHTRTINAVPFGAQRLVSLKTDTVCLGAGTLFNTIFSGSFGTNTVLVDHGDGSTHTSAYVRYPYDSCGAYDVSVYVSETNLCCPGIVNDTITKRVYVKCPANVQPNALGQAFPYNDTTTAFCCVSSVLTKQNISCSGGNNGSCNVFGRGLPPFDYELLNLLDTVLQSQYGDMNDHTFSGLSPGTYKLKTIDGNGCLNTQQFTILDSASAYISGYIRSEMGEPISIATVNAAAQYDITDSSGYYLLGLTCGSNDTVMPSKANDITVSNGVSTADILLIRKHILSMQLLNSPYKIIAADVDLSGAVSTLDILLMRSLILGNTGSFPSGRLWSFVSSNYVFPDPQNPFPFPNYRSYMNIQTDYINQDFIGMKLGDVNNNWNPSTPKTGAIGSLQLAMDEYDVLQGEAITVPVKVKDFKAISGYQFTLSWDVGVLLLLQVNNKALQGYFGDRFRNEGRLTTVWYDEMTTPVSLDDDAVAFELIFEVIGRYGSFSPIVIDSELTACEAYHENADVLNIVSKNGRVNVGDARSPNTQHSTRITLSVQPNPFSNTTNIIFSIPQDEMVIIAIYDILGREVQHLKADYEQGEHQMAWAGDDKDGHPLNKGLYHVRMIVGDNAVSAKAVLMR